MKNKRLANWAFLSHLPILIIWFGLFFVPLSIFPQRVAFHFWFLVTLFSIQIIWGIILYPKARKLTIICPLTSLTQYFRGYKIGDKKNWNHSFVAEFLKKFKIHVSFDTVNYILWISFVIVIAQYFN